MTKLLLLLSLLFCVSAAAENNYQQRPLSERVHRLERLINSQNQLNLLNRLAQLQQENQQLRALLEEQHNTIQLLRQQQREHYADLNRRLSQMEGAAEDTISVNSQTSLTELAEPLDKPLDNNRTKIPITPVMIVKPLSPAERKAEQADYETAYNELRSRRYSQARDLFATLIQHYPGGHYAHLAQYWIAEASYAQHNYKQAVIDYQRLIDVYPFSPKQAEAELKKASSYYELGNKESARNTLKRLLINYSNTTEAVQAKRLLKKI